MASTCLAEECQHEQCKSILVKANPSGACVLLSQELAPKYFAHLAAAMRDGQRTCLAKIMGVYTVSSSWFLRALACWPATWGDR